MLDGRKRSVEDAHCSDATAAPAKKGSKVDSTTVYQFASPQENCASKGSKRNCTIVKINATTVHGVARILRASGMGVVVDDKLA